MKTLLLRHAILTQLHAAQPASLATDTIAQGVRLAGHDTTSATLQNELLYLEDRTLITTAPHPLDPSLPRYRLTATGRDYLATQGLA